MGLDVIPSEGGVPDVKEPDVGNSPCCFVFHYKASSAASAAPLE